MTSALLFICSKPTYVTLRARSVRSKGLLARKAKFFLRTPKTPGSSE